jgi:hypothetical protein
MRMRALAYAAAALVAASVSASALAASSAQTTPDTTARLKAFLTVNQEIPTPNGARGSGTFTATVSGRTIKFRLTFTGLTGPAAAAHIHASLAGKANPAPLVALCGPCRNGQRGTVTAPSAAAVKKILGGATYVNVHTAKNAGGEIRGQIASS